MCTNLFLKSEIKNSWPRLGLNIGIFSVNYNVSLILVFSMLIIPFTTLFIYTQDV